MFINVRSCFAVVISLVFLASCAENKETESAAIPVTADTPVSSAIAADNSDESTYVEVETPEGKGLKLYDKQLKDTFLVEDIMQFQVLKPLKKDSAEGMFLNLEWGDYYHFQMQQGNSIRSFFVIETTPGLTDLDTLETDTTLAGKVKVRATWEESKVYMPEAGYSIQTIPILTKVKIVGK